MSDDAGRMAELSEAFAPATIPGITRRYWELGREIHDLEQERANYGRILLEWMQTTGEVIEVEGLPALRLVKAFEWRGGVPREKTKIKFDRKGSIR